MTGKVSGEIIASGSELMLGQMVDTNSAWISRRLCETGVRIDRHTTLGDNLPYLITAFQRAWEEHQVVVVTGGLGPTEDDLTRQAAAEAFGLRLEYHENLADEMRELFQRRGYVLTDNNLRQAYLPQGSLLIPNHMGTAPGFALADEGRLMAFLPGVPAEMKRMYDDWVEPQVKKQFKSLGGILKTVVLKSAGLGESVVDSRLHDLMGSGRNPEVGLLAAPDMVRVLVTAEGHDEAEVEKILAPTLEEVKTRLRGHYFSTGEQSLPDVVADMLEKRELSLTILDAVTQGRLSGILGPCLSPGSWNGAKDLPWQPALGGVMDILRLHEPESAVLQPVENRNVGRRKRHEVCLIATGRRTAGLEEQGADITQLVVETAVTLSDGQADVREHRLGANDNWAMTRIASLAVFHLWQALTEYRP